MVRVKGPVLSQAAAGGLGKTLIFAQSKGRSYVKRWEKPRNPSSASQIAMRAVTRFCSQRWVDLAEVDRATYAASAETANIPIYNAYLGYQLERWRSFRPLTDAYDPTPAGITCQITSWTATAVSRGVLHSLTVSDPRNARWINLHRRPSDGNFLQWPWLRQVVMLPAAATYIWTDRPLTPATYYYRLLFSTTTGLAFTQSTLRTVTVT